MKDLIDSMATGKIQIDDVINKLNEHVRGAIKISNPLNIAENLHNGHYVDRSNVSQLWSLKRFYDTLHYNIGLIDVGKKFLSQKNYHGAFESFHSAKYSQGLLDMTKSIVNEVKAGRRDNIGYARKALVDIVGLEGNNRVHKYINTIADAYIKEYQSLLKTHHGADDSYLYDALGLYKLNNNVLGIAKATAKIAYYKMAHKEDSHSKSIGIENHFNS